MILVLIIMAMARLLIRKNGSYGIGNLLNLGLINMAVALLLIDDCRLRSYGIRSSMLILGLINIVLVLWLI